MAGVTPDVESDVLQKLAELLPTLVIITGTDDEITGTAGPLRPNGVPDKHEVFVQLFGGQRDVHSDGVLRTFSIQVTVRSIQNDYTGGHQAATDVHDALEQLGAWTGASGQRYVDTNAQLAAPNYLGSDDADQELFGEPFDVVAETLR